MSSVTPKSLESMHRRVRRGNAGDHDQVRRKLLDAAFALHDRAGLASLSMRALASEVGLSPMATYRYYPSKTDLLLAMWDSILTDALSQTRAAASRQRSARGRLRAAIAAFLLYWETRPSHFRLVFMTEETMRPGPVPALVGSAAYQHAVEFGREQTEAFIAEVGGRPDRALIARDLRMAMMVGYLHARLVNQRFPWSDFEALRDSVVDAIMLGIETCVKKAPRRAAGRAQPPASTRRISVP